MARASRYGSGFLAETFSSASPTCRGRRGRRAPFPAWEDTKTKRPPDHGRLRQDLPCLVAQAAQASLDGSLHRGGHAEQGIVRVVRVLVEIGAPLSVLDVQDPLLEEALA